MDLSAWIKIYSITNNNNITFLLDSEWSTA